MKLFNIYLNKLEIIVTQCSLLGRVFPESLGEPRREPQNDP